METSNSYRLWPQATDDVHTGQQDSYYYYFVWDFGLPNAKQAGKGRHLRNPVDTTLPTPAPD